ncbi:MAG: hypothetical protein II652_07180, partial [Bacteroidales bacterium]|nr:hypothetical protein [Bacteroidales bacterium]
RHPQFFRGIDYQMGGNLTEFVGDDLEYVLWDLYVNRYSYQGENSEVYRELLAKVGDRYPNGPYLEYSIIVHKVKATAIPLLEGFVEKYDGRGISFWARQELICNELSDLRTDKDPDTSFKAVYDKGKVFEKERKALRGVEAKVAEGCTRVSDLLEQLSAKSLGVTIKGEKIVVSMQNLETAEVSLSKGKNSLYNWTAENKRKSFYLTDTVRISLPKLADGEYTVRAKKGKLEDSCDYEQYTLSIASRQDKEGLSVYVADFKSGEPLRNAHISLLRSGKEVAATDMKLNPHFTLLPDAFQKMIKESSVFYLVASYGDRKSKEAYLYRESWREDNTQYDGYHCHIYKDRGAYNPGDEVKFKAVLCYGNLVDRIKVVEGRPLTAILLNSERKEIGKKSLTTNEFGSISGSFSLPADQRNGQFTLKILDGEKGSLLASDSFQVDEFVLPTYTLEFEKVEKLCLPGEEVSLKGRLTSYSGHSLSGARLEVVVDRYGSRVYETSLTPGKDGRFHLAFIPKDSGYHHVTVTVVDATGETSEFGTGIYVANSINLYLSVLNALDGTFERNRRSSEKSYRFGSYYGRDEIVAEENAEVTFTVRNSDSQKVPLKVLWTLLDEKEKKVSEGTAESGQTLKIKLPATGLYTLKAVSEVEGTVIKSERSLTILRLSLSDKALPCKLSKVLISGATAVASNADMEMYAGASDGPLWAVATLFGKDRTPLAVKAIALNGKDHSFERIAFPYLDSYPDAVRLMLFYFRNGEAVTYEKEFSRIRTRLTLPLKVTSFRNSAFPGTEYSFEWKTDPGVEAVASVYDKSIDAIQKNEWGIVSLRDFSVPYVPVSSTCGNIGLVFHYEVYKSAGRAKGAAMGGVVEDMALMAEPMAVEKAGAVATNEAAPEPEEVAVRENFEAALAFEPHLLSDKNGKITLKFSTSDKLSTYYVALYAHDKTMRNALSVCEMTVSIPVKVSLVQPQFLYEGDSYEAAVSVSSNSSKNIKGQLYLYVYPTDSYKGGEPVSVQKTSVTVPAGE